MLVYKTSKIIINNQEIMNNKNVFSACNSILFSLNNYFIQCTLTRYKCFKIGTVVNGRNWFIYVIKVFKCINMFVALIYYYIESPFNSITIYKSELVWFNLFYLNLNFKPSLLKLWKPKICNRKFWTQPLTNTFDLYLFNWFHHWLKWSKRFNIH